MQRIASGTAFVMVVVLCGFALHANAGEENTPARLDWMVKAYGDGRHNAFTDLIRWKDMYYLCFRHGEHHSSMDGEIRVMRSADLKVWEPCGTLKTYGDDRDPHFAATEDRLYVYFGVWDLEHAEDHGTPSRQDVRSHFALSEDGETWSKVQGVYDQKWWLWRVQHHADAFYSIAYSAFRPRPSMRESRLLRSENGLDWEYVSTVTKERMSGEADMWFDDDGSMWLVTRTGERPGHAWLHRAGPDKQTWTAHDLGDLIHSPAIVNWKDRFFVAGRGRKTGGGFVTRLWELYPSEHRVRELLTLPSGGDTSYPGLLVDPASRDAENPALFISWYSQHEQESAPNYTKNTASVYVARIIIDK
ncbi:MAG: hypothetical protein R6V12_11435 [Candidatus Hydrogenedentota bacterium]